MEYESIERECLVNEIKSILKEQDVRLDDNFIELGGNSIMGMVLADNLLKKNGVKINLAQLLGNRIGSIELKALDE